MEESNLSTNFKSESDLVPEKESEEEDDDQKNEKKDRKEMEGRGTRKREVPPPTQQMKKPRIVWSGELHNNFVSVVNQLGVNKAVPKKILELMNVKSLTRENVASHLQKYRIYKRKGIKSNHTDDQHSLDPTLRSNQPATFQSLNSAIVSNHHKPVVPYIGSLNSYAPNFCSPRVRPISVQQVNNQVSYYNMPNGMKLQNVPFSGITNTNFPQSPGKPILVMQNSQQEKHFSVPAHQSSGSVFHPSLYVLSSPTGSYNHQQVHPNDLKKVRFVKVNGCMNGYVPSSYNSLHMKAEKDQILSHKIDNMQGLNNCVPSFISGPSQNIMDNLIYKSAPYIGHQQTPSNQDAIYNYVEEEKNNSRSTYAKQIVSLTTEFAQQQNNILYENSMNSNVNCLDEIFLDNVDEFIDVVEDKTEELTRKLADQEL